MRRVMNDRPADADVPQPEAFDGSAARKMESRMDADAERLFAERVEAEVRLRLAKAERRRSDRTEQDGVEGWVSAASGQSLTSGRRVAIRDLSLHGVGLTSDKPYRLNAAHWIVVSRGPMRLSTRFRVASCTQREDGQSWDVGGEFF